MSIAPPDPRTEPDAVARLRGDLTGWTSDAVAAALGERAVAALDREQLVPALVALAGRAEPVALLTRLFMLGDRLTEAEIDLALPTAAADARRLGLVRDGRATLDVRPVSIGGTDRLLAADLGESTTGQGVRADHVLGLGGASATLAHLTVREPVDLALDLGTGSGIQALGLVGHARRVIATDVSERALACARFTLALNDLGTGEPGERVELRLGSMLEPVADERFDLIVSNPPFVISPRTGVLPTYTYRDGGLGGDTLLADLLRGLRAVLAPGGVAQLLGNWEVHEGAWGDRVEGWLTASGLDAWVIQRELLDPAAYVETWLRDGGMSPERDRTAWAEGYRGWMADLDARGVTALGFGYLTLRRPRTEREPVLRLEEITGTVAPVLGETIALTLAADEALAEGLDLGGERLAVAGDVTEERHYVPGAPDPSVIVLRQGGGLARTVRADTLLAAIVGACDGELTVGQICAGVAALLDVDPGAVRADVLPALRGLYVDGLLARA